MSRYIVCSIHIKPAAKKGQLPDISYSYIANESHIGWHYTLTNERENAYVFDEEEIKDAEFIANCWGMKIQKLI